MIEWKPFIHNPEYLISNDGQVNSLIRNKILDGFVSDIGYKRFRLKIYDGKYMVFYAHRLVGFHFLDNPNSLNEINHKDLNKLNNWHENLEWTTHRNNIKHARSNKKWNPKPSESIRRGLDVSAHTRHLLSAAKCGSKHPKFSGWYVVNGKRYGSAPEAERSTGIKQHNIKLWCKKDIRPGFSFEPLSERVPKHILLRQS